MAKKKTKKTPNTSSSSAANSLTKEQVKEAIKVLLDRIGPCAKYRGFVDLLWREAFPAEDLETICGLFNQVICDVLEHTGDDGDLDIMRAGGKRWICLG